MQDLLFHQDVMAIFCLCVLVGKHRELAYPCIDVSNFYQVIVINYSECQWCIGTGTEWNGVPVDFFKPQVSGTAVPVEKIPRIILNICETSAFSMLSF